ncbi:MAG: exosortase/archaeosortase family protein [Deltaproteobacteria bacterium]|nr:exosortase/archaeosortase family protein [Deltaproteobacteria bacterium]
MITDRQRKVAGFLIFIVALSFILFDFYPALFEVYNKCQTNDDYSHGVLLPFVSVILLWFKREELAAKLKAAAGEAVRFSSLGLVIFLAGILIDTFAQLTGELLFIRWIALYFLLTGLILLSFGNKVGWLFVPPILLIFMARPIPESLIPILFNPLQVLAASVGAWTLELLSVPVYLRGNVIEVPGLTLLVEEACSGMRSVISMLTVACIISYYTNLRFLGFILITAIAAGVAVIFNILRVTITGVLAHFVSPDTATGFFHEFTGMVVFVLGLLIMFSLTRLMMKWGWLAEGEEKA